MNQSVDPQINMMAALKQGMPSMKHQTQFTAFMIAFDSLRLLCDAICAGDSEREQVAMSTLGNSIDSIRQATQLAKQAMEIPPEERGSATNALIQPPIQFTEYDIQKELLGGLGRIVTLKELNEWYEHTKTKRDQVISQTLRNVLMDSIRQKKESIKKLGETQ